MAHSRKTAGVQVSSSWKRILGGVTVLFLLTPMPVWALIYFHGWNPVTYTGNHLFGGGPGNIDVDISNPTQLTFYLNGGDTRAGGTTTITSLPLNVDSTFDTLKGNWSGLHSLAIQSGSVTISVTVYVGPFPGTTNNMFGGADGVTLNSTSTFDSGPLTPSNNLLNTVSYITVNFDYRSGIEINPASATHFVLTFSQ
jgi:hypothetical protein